MKARTFVLAILATAALTVSAFSAELVSPVDPEPTVYDGSCQITGVNATAVYAGNGLYSDNGSMNFTCTGTFYGRITACLFLDDPNAIVCSTSGVCGAANFSFTSKEWPIMGTSCVTVYGMTQCYTIVKEAKPVNATLSLAPLTSRSKFTSRAVVEWITGPCRTFLGATVCPTQSVTASKATKTLIPVTN